MEGLTPALQFDLEVAREFVLRAALEWGAVQIPGKPRHGEKRRLMEAIAELNRVRELCRKELKPSERLDAIDRIIAEGDGEEE